MTALRLHAIAAADGMHGASPRPTTTRLVALRELAAIVSDTPAFAAPAITPEQVEAHRNVVDACFQRGPVLPAPVGVIFRSEETLVRWMDLHYVALHDGLIFVEDRVAARVHLCRRPECDPKEESGTDVAAIAAAVFRDLRRRAVAALPLRVEHFTGLVVSSAFLVERIRWEEFAASVAELETGHPDLAFTWSGPWAPYDFVQMQFGG